MAQDLQQLLQARNNASITYNEMLRAPENNLEDVMSESGLV